MEKKSQKDFTAPSHYAVTTKEVEVETGGQSVQENEKSAEDGGRE